MRKIFCLTLLLYFFITLFPRDALAIENFDAVYNVTYKVGEDENTKATIQVALTNTSDRYYADSYTLQVGFDKIENVKATDPDGQLAPKITKNEDGQKIELIFNKKVMGKGKTLNFTISFDTPDVARKQGKIWEINIPGISNADEFKNFNVEVKPPYFLEEPLYIKPKRKDNDLKFTKEELGKSGISLAFGKEQIYEFKLNYHLQNDNIFPIKKEVTLPPTTNYQEIYLESLTPKPLNVILDPDGNWLAEYTLSPGQKIDITASGKAQIFLTPKKQALTATEKNIYTNEDKYWETTNPQITELAHSLKTPENIYKFVVENLKYDFRRVNTNQKRLGAAKVLLQRDRAVCLEFTDLFITIARAAGIPAREVNGFAFTENSKQRPLSRIQDILHAWPEYYDATKETWIMIDPTWSNTTGGIDYFNVFDLDHVAFVIKGVSSTSPLPAGAYKFDGQTKKDIHLTFTNTPGSSKKKVNLDSLFNKVYSSQLPITGKIQVENTGQTLLINQDLNITSNSLTPNKQIGHINSIPPFGHQVIKVSFKSLPLLTNKVFEFKMRLIDQEMGVLLSVAPFNLTIDHILIFIYAITAAIIIWATAQGAWRLLISRWKK